MRKTILAISLAVISHNTVAQCPSEEGRFDNDKLVGMANDLAVVTDKFTQLQWIKCPLGQTGVSCEGQAQTVAHSDATSVIESFNAGLNVEDQGWRLPTVQELLTITHLECERGYHDQYFNITHPYSEINDVFVKASEFKSYLDILFDEHAQALEAFNEQRSVDDEFDKKINEYIQVQSALYNLNGLSWSRENSNKMHKEIRPWLTENSPEFNAVNDTQSRFEMAPMVNKSYVDGSDIMSLRAIYGQGSPKIDQMYLTNKSDISVSFRVTPRLDTYRTPFFEVGYSYQQITLARTSWNGDYVRLVRDAPVQ